MNYLKFTNIHQSEHWIIYMLKNKSIDYIFGMITGASLMLAFWACTNTPLGASGSDVQQVEIVNSKSWDPVYVEITN